MMFYFPLVPAEQRRKMDLVWSSIEGRLEWRRLLEGCWREGWIVALGGVDTGPCAHTVTHKEYVFMNRVIIGQGLFFMELRPWESEGCLYW